VSTVEKVIKNGTLVFDKLNRDGLANTNSTR
jgi:hypothetical protein